MKNFWWRLDLDERIIFIFVMMFILYIGAQLLRWVL
jgi:hypothetical protein